MRTLIATLGCVVAASLPPALQAGPAQATPTACADLEIIAHRAVHTAGIDENSMAAFQRAIDLGYSIETDVWPDKDGQIWFFHDRDVARTTNGTGMIDHMTTAEVAALRYRKAGSPLPTLEEGLALFAAHPERRVYIEIKAPRSIDEVADAIEASGRRQSTWVTAFPRQTHAYDPDIMLMYKDFGTRLRPPAQLVAEGISIVGLLPDQVTTANVDDYHAAGIEVQDRLANRADEWRRTINTGADGQLTDYPETLTEYCTSTYPPPTISAVSSASGQPGDDVLVTGQDLGRTVAVSFTSTAGPEVEAAFTVLSGGRLSVTVPDDVPAVSYIQVLTPRGDATSADPFQVAPSVLSFSPGAGPPGSLVDIVGPTLGDAQSVTVGGTPASIVARSPRRVSVVVPATAPTLSTLRVATSAGAADSVGQYGVAPVIDTIAAAAPGSVTVVTGPRVGDATGVALDGVAAPFTRVSASQLALTVPAGTGTSAALTVQTVGGSATGRIDTSVDTTITSGPAAVLLARRTSLAYSSTSPGSVFDCRLDGKVLPCSATGLTTPRLRPGSHRITVAARTPTGLADGSPAAVSFTVPVDDHALAGTSSWHRARDRDAYRGSTLQAGQAGATLAYRVHRASQLFLVVRGGRGEAGVRVYLGDTLLRTVDAPRRGPERIATLAAFARPRSGTVRIVSTSGRSVRIDALGIVTLEAGSMPAGPARPAAGG